MNTSLYARTAANNILFAERIDGFISSYIDGIYTCDCKLKKIFGNKLSNCTYIDQSKILKISIPKKNFRKDRIMYLSFLFLKTYLFIKQKFNNI